MDITRVTFQDYKFIFIFYSCRISSIQNFTRKKEINKKKFYFSTPKLVSSKSDKITPYYLHYFLFYFYFNAANLQLAVECQTRKILISVGVQVYYHRIKTICTLLVGEILFYNQVASLKINNHFMYGLH